MGTEGKGCSTDSLTSCLAGSASGAAGSLTACCVAAGPGFGLGAGSERLAEAAEVGSWPRVLSGAGASVLIGWCKLVSDLLLATGRAV